MISDSIQAILPILQARPELLNAANRIHCEVGGEGLEAYVTTVLPQSDPELVDFIWTNYVVICVLLAEFTRFRIWNFQVEGGRPVGFPIREIAHETKHRGYLTNG